MNVRVGSMTWTCKIGHWVKELFFFVFSLLISCCRVISRANLTALDAHLGVAQHVAVHGATIHGAFHIGRVANGHLGFAHNGHQVDEALVIMDAGSTVSRIDDCILGGVVAPAFAAAEHMAAVVVVLEVVVAITWNTSHFDTHLRLVGTDDATPHGDLGFAGTCKLLDIADVESPGIAADGPRKMTHVGHLATAVHGTEDARTLANATYDGVRNEHLSVLDQRHKQGRSLGVSGNADGITLAGAVNVAHGAGNPFFDDGVVTDYATAHPDEGVAVFHVGGVG